jgi:alkanesulfonate monooxygenase SsuD/methylene tetrahydromethanopterin reductase-like flavin-dependent oxidoreductase (luciferase family)
MKFYTFDELTYPAVPPEFGPEMRFTNRFCDPQAVYKTYHEHLDEWAVCEDLGFDGAFVNEHHFTAINIQPSCNITATAIMMRTKRMKVGVIGNILPLRHPVQTAEEFAMMDCLSGGRFIAGIVRGVPFEYVSYNVDPFTSRERLKESYEIIQKCLTEEVFDYEGKYWKLTGVSIWPKPIQQPLPFWMPTGSLETIEFAAERHISGAQVFYPSYAFKDSFDLYRKVAHERFGWEASYDNFVGARLLHVAETNEQAIAEAREAIAYFFRVFSRPVNNPAPVPGLHTDRSFQHRQNIERDFPGPHTPFEQMREDGFIVCGDPDYVTRYLENDMRLAGYGHFLGMFHVGNLAHEKVMKSKRLFAEHIMPVLRPLNVDEPATLHPVTPAASTYQVSGTRTQDVLPLYSDFNYVLTRDVLETVGAFTHRENGTVSVGWDMLVPEREADGFPYQIIFVGPTAEHRGSAIRLRLVTNNGAEVTDEAKIRLEASHESGTDQQVIFQGTYRQFKDIADQHAPNAAVAAQRRVVAQDRYVIRLRVTVSEGSPQPDPEAEDSYFELECFKHVLNVTA